MSLAHSSEDQDPGLDKTVALLGGIKLLRHPVPTRLAAHDLLTDGLPGHALEHLVKQVAILQAPQQQNLERAIGISLRTYQRRKEAPEKPLSPEQSGRTWKFAEILARAIDIFGSQPEAERWLEQPATGLEQRRPIDLLSTPAGVETLEDHLTRLEFGVYA